MIEALYKLGNVIKSVGELEDFFDDINSGKSNLKTYILKIMIDINDKNNISYHKIELEEYSKEKKLKYLYKESKGQSPLYTPTVKKAGELNKSYKRLKNFFKSYLERFKNSLNENDKYFIKQLENIIISNEDSITSDLMQSITSKKDSYVITLGFEEDRSSLYVGDIETFTTPYKNSDENKYKSYFCKYGVESKSKNEKCYICNKTGQVWGFVDTFKFYTVDKKSFVTGGFNQALAWKNYPVCKDCALVLDRAKDYIEKTLNYKFCGFSYFVVPEMIFDDNEQLKTLLSRMEKYTDFTLQEDKADRIAQTEEKILEELSKESNAINFNFLFYEKTKSAFNILLYLQEIPPTRLNELITAKQEIDDSQQRKYDIFEEIPIKNNTISFNFSFRFLRDFFPNKELEGKYDKDFLSILNNIFTKKMISSNFLFSRFLERFRMLFNNKKSIYIDVLKSYKIILFLENIDILDRRKGSMSQDNTIYDDFFKENAIFDDYTKKALFLEGVLTRKLLNIQYNDRSATPFRSRLNGLKIDSRTAKRLLPEIINKLEEYDKNYYKSLEEILGQYLLKSDFTKYSVDEMSYYFVLGMVLEKTL